MYLTHVWFWVFLYNNDNKFQTDVFDPFMAFLHDNIINDDDNFKHIFEPFKVSRITI